jgi:hypothetical protein
VGLPRAIPESHASGLRRSGCQLLAFPRRGDHSVLWRNWMATSRLVLLIAKARSFSQGRIGSRDSTLVDATFLMPRASSSRRVRRHLIFATTLNASSCA